MSLPKCFHTRPALLRLVLGVKRLEEAALVVVVAVHRRAVLCADIDYDGALRDFGWVARPDQLGISEGRQLREQMNGERLVGMERA